MSTSDSPNATLAYLDLDSTDFGGADFESLHSEGNIGNPTALPDLWSLVQGYLVGPGAIPGFLSANLAGADLSGLNLTGIDLSSADLTTPSSGSTGSGSCLQMCVRSPSHAKMPPTPDEMIS